MSESLHPALFLKLQCFSFLNTRDRTQSLQHVRKALDLLSIWGLGLQADLFHCVDGYVGDT
jgi:hypothetical protein